MIRLNSPTSFFLLLLGWDTPTQLSQQPPRRASAPGFPALSLHLPREPVSPVRVERAPAQQLTLGHPPLPEGHR